MHPSYVLQSPFELGTQSNEASILLALRQTCVSLLAMWNRKEYDRKRAAKLYGVFKKRRMALFKELGGCCSLCSKKAVKGFHLHHVKYHAEESDCPTHSKSMSVRLKRLEEAEQNPDRFRLLCPRCHMTISHLETVLRKDRRSWDTLSELLASK